jgi:hypothetical protein
VPTEVASQTLKLPSKLQKSIASKELSGLVSQNKLAPGSDSKDRRLRFVRYSVSFQGQPFDPDVIERATSTDYIS